MTENKRKRNPQSVENSKAGGIDDDPDVKPTGLALERPPEMTIHPMRMTDVLDAFGALCPNCQAILRVRLAKHLEPRTPVEIAIERMYPIVVQVAHEMHLAAEAIIGTSMKNEYVEARRRISLRARKAGFTFTAIGRALGRHHTTIVHAVKPRSVSRKSAEIST